MNTFDKKFEGNNKVVCFFIFFFLFTFFCDASFRISVIFDEENKIHKAISQDFIGFIQANMSDSEIKVFTINPSFNEKELRKEITFFFPEINIVFGDKTASFAKTLTFFPMLYALVKNPEKVGLVDRIGTPLHEANGIMYVPNVQKIFKQIKKTVPELKSVGTFYLPEFKDQLKDVKDGLQKIGIKLKTHDFDPSKLFSRNMRGLIKKEIDAYLIMPETLDISDWNFEYMVTSCQGRGIKTISLDPSFKSDSLDVVVDIDTSKIGVKMGKMALAYRKSRNIKKVGKVSSMPYKLIIGEPSGSSQEVKMKNDKPKKSFFNLF